MYKILSPLSYLLILITVHKAVLWYFNKKEETVGEKSKVIDNVREKLDGYIYQFGLVIFISWLIEYYSGFYFAADMASTLQHFSEQGLTKAQVSNWRCSGAYFFARSCDQKKSGKGFRNKRLAANAVNWGYVTVIPIYDKEQISGIYISCSPGHAKKLKETIAVYKWDGPSPIHSEDDCKPDESRKFNTCGSNFKGFEDFY